MALGIFAGTGMDVKAEAGNQRFEWEQLDSRGDSWEQFLRENEFIYLANTNISNDELAALAQSMVVGSLYILGRQYGQSGLYYCALSNVEGYVTAENYDDLKKQYTSWYILKEKSSLPESTGSSETSGSASTDSNAPSVPHTHSYSWVTVQDVSSEQDGIEEYRCSCGDVQERCVIPRYMAIVKGLYGAVKDAPQNGTATFDTGSAFTMTDYVIRKLSERTDVTTVITFEYQNQAYKMTIPAGTDFTGLLADEEYFYGYFFFANAVGATIEAIA